MEEFVSALISDGSMQLLAKMSIRQLGGKKIFSTLDVHTSYWQIKMEESLCKKTAFATMEGLYKFHVMPFDLCNAPATFQRLLQKILAGLGVTNHFVYILMILLFFQIQSRGTSPSYNKFLIVSAVLA